MEWKLEPSDQRWLSRTIPPILVAGILLGLLFPISFERTSPSFLDFRNGLGRASHPYGLIDHLYQLNLDQIEYIKLHQDFPGQYYSNVIRINQPMHSLITNVVCRLTGVMGDGCTYNHAWFTAIWLNIIWLALALVMVAAASIRLGLSRRLTTMVLAMLSLSRFSESRLLDAGTNEITLVVFAGFLLGVAILLKSRERFAERAAPFIGAAWGLLLLTKPHVEVFTCSLVVLVWFRMFRVTGITLFCSAFIVASWVGILKAMGLPFQHHDIEHHGLVRWFLDLLLAGDLVALGRILVEKFVEYFFVEMPRIFGWMVLAAATIGMFSILRSSQAALRTTFRLVLVLGSIHFLFYFMTGSTSPSVIFASFYLVFTTAAVGWQTLCQWSTIRNERAMGILGCLLLLINAALFLRLQEGNPQFPPLLRILTEALSLAQR